MFFRMYYARMGKRWEDFMTLRKREIFFGVVASAALIQIFRKEYDLRQRKAALDQATPQSKNRIKLLESVKATENPYGPKAEWRKNG